MWLALSLLLTAHPATGDKACGACHREQQVQLDASAHGHVFTSPLFQLSWKSNGTRGWCLTCHARTGMTCESCHDPKTFGPVGEATCARCHQFKAPEARFAAVAMQNTLEEWKRAGTSTTCAGCHFDHTHRSAGGHDVELLRRTLSVTWKNGCATVTAKDAGHAVPTGDPFHHLVLSACESATCELQIERKLLQRRIRTSDDGGVRELSDTRPFPSVEVCFVAGTHFRLEMVHAEVQLTDAPPLERSLVILEGEITRN